MVKWFKRMIRLDEPFDYYSSQSVFLHYLFVLFCLGTSAAIIPVVHSSQQKWLVSNNCDGAIGWQRSYLRIIIVVISIYCVMLIVTLKFYEGKVTWKHMIPLPGFCFAASRLNLAEAVSNIKLELATLDIDEVFRELDIVFDDRQKHQFFEEIDNRAQEALIMHDDKFVRKSRTKLTLFFSVLLNSALLSVSSAYWNSQDCTTRSLAFNSLNFFSISFLTILSFAAFCGQSDLSRLISRELSEDEVFLLALLEKNKHEKTSPDVNQDSILSRLRWSLLHDAESYLKMLSNSKTQHDVLASDSVTVFLTKKT